MSDLSNTVYDPQSERTSSFLKLWGTRGSVPVSGSTYTSFGGNTCCLEVRRHHRSIIIDAGTGIRAVGDDLLDSDIRVVHLFFGHTHWDHLIGFPFFMPLYNPEFTVHVYAMENKEKKIEDALHQVLWPDYFPVQLDQMKADIQFHSLDPNASLPFDDLTLSYVPCNHPGGALAFKLELPQQTIGYCTDHEFLEGYRGPPSAIDADNPLLEPYREVIDFFTGCDLLIHEAQYTPREYRSKASWGHSSMANAALLVKLAKIDEWIITHHDPAATDQDLHFHHQLFRRILRDADYHCHIDMAFDGYTLPLF